jgi:hypothetical protein
MARSESLGLWGNHTGRRRARPRTWSAARSPRHRRSCRCLPCRAADETCRRYPAMFLATVEINRSRGLTRSRDSSNEAGGRRPATRPGAAASSARTRQARGPEPPRMAPSRGRSPLRTGKAERPSDPARRRASTAPGPRAPAGALSLEWARPDGPLPSIGGWTSIRWLVG